MTILLAKKYLGLGFLLATTSLNAQRPTWDEIGGGAAYNVALRIPVLALPKVARGPIPRLALFTIGSLTYEVFVDPHHQMTDSIGGWTSTGQMRADILGRQLGYLAGEVIVALLRYSWNHRR